MSKIYLRFVQTQRSLILLLRPRHLLTDSCPLLPVFQFATPDASESLAALKLLSGFCRHSLLWATFLRMVCQFAASAPSTSLLISRAEFVQENPKVIKWFLPDKVSQFSQNGKLINFVQEQSDRRPYAPKTC